MAKKQPNIENVLEGLFTVAEKTRPGVEMMLGFVEEIKALSKEELAGLMAELKSLHEFMDKNKSMIGSLYDAVRVEYLPEKMDEDGVSSFKLDRVGRITLTDDLRVKVLDKDAQFEWLEESGNGDLISETVNASSLKALLRRMMENGEETPGEIFEISPFTRASITKS